MGVTFHDYIDGDVAKIEMRDGDMLGMPMEQVVRPAWTMKVDGKVVACSGLFESCEGVYNSWSVVGDDARGHGAAMTKFLRARFDSAFESLGIHRIQSVVRGDKKEYQRYMEMFGFQKEGVARKATPDKTDLIMYGRII